MKLFCQPPSRCPRAELPPAAEGIEGARPGLRRRQIGKPAGSAGSTMSVAPNAHRDPCRAVADLRKGLAGTVSLCSRGGTHRYGVTGRTLNWRGTAFRITSCIIERSDGRGVQLGSSEGEWDGKDEIRVNTHLRLFLIKNGSWISTTDGWIRTKAGEMDVLSDFITL